MKLLDRVRDSLIARLECTPRQRVLKALLADPASEKSVLDLMRTAHVFAGTIYPILIGLERQSIVMSRWKGLAPPRRRLYTLTQQGIEAANQELGSIRATT